MEGRLPAALQLEMTDGSPVAYAAERAPQWGRARVSLFTNANRDREDLPRTIAEFSTLAVVELDRTDAPSPDPPGPDIVHSFRFERTARPGQGSLGGGSTAGLQLVLISPRDESAAQELRDWGDFVHIRHIAEAAVPGFGMITPYANAGDGPRFLHLYELHTHDPEAAFLSMTPRVAQRLGGDGSAAFREWAWHPQLRIDYVNTFVRVEHE